LSKQWFLRKLRILQFNIEDPYGYMLESIKPKEIVDLAKKLHANTLVIFARDGWGRTFYKSKVYPAHPKARNDFLKEIVEYAKNQDVKVVVMIAHTSNKWLYREHPDWVQRTINGEVIALDSIPVKTSVEDFEWPLACLNSPFKDIILKEVEETLAYNVDALMLDSFRYQPDLGRACYCKYCKEQFKKDTGYELPTKQDWNSIEWRKAWEWRYSIVAKRIKEIKKKMKELSRTNIPLIYNNHPAGWGGRTARIVEELRDTLDVVFAECSEVDHEPMGFLIEMVKLTQALSGGKPTWASRNYFHMYRPPTATTPTAIKQGILEIFIAGGSPLVLIFLSSYIQDKRLLDVIAQEFSRIERIEDYMDDVEPLRYVGVVFSSSTRDWYGKDKPEPYTSEVRGFFFANLYSNIPVEFIVSPDIRYEELRKYKCIILANTACISDEQAKEIERYVVNGGGLIASYQTSLYTEKGNERYDFALSNLIGAHYYGLLKVPWSYIQLEKDHAITEGIGTKLILWGDMSYEFKNTRTEGDLAYHVLTRNVKGETIARIAQALGEYGYEYTLGKSAPPPGNTLDSPSIITNIIGKGRVVYFTGQLGRMYWRTGLPEYQTLIINSIKWASNAKPPIITNAPETVRVIAYRSKDNTRIIIHLLNQTTNQRILLRPTGSSKYKLPGFSENVAMHPPRTIIPVHNIEVAINNVNMDNYVVYEPLTNTKIEYKIKERTLTFTIKELQDYKLIVIEKKK